METPKLARKQVERRVPFERRPDNRAPGQPIKREVSEYRCHPTRDVGLTRAADDLGRFCIRFARGYCHMGGLCTCLHRLPTAQDEQRLATDTHDIFGRPRQDEGASIHSASHRTLFVDITGATPLAIQELRPIIENNFAVWGPLEYVKVLRERAVVFVRYKYFVSACFAKEAMSRQHLTGSNLGEVLFVKWAREDTSAAAMERDARDREHALAAAYSEAVNEHDPEVKRRKIEALQYGMTSVADISQPLFQQVEPAPTKHMYKEKGKGTDDQPNWFDFYYQQGGEGEGDGQQDDPHQGGPPETQGDTESGDEEVGDGESGAQEDWRAVIAQVDPEGGDEEEGEDVHEGVVTGWEEQQQAVPPMFGGGKKGEKVATTTIAEDDEPGGLAMLAQYGSDSD